VLEADVREHGHARVDHARRVVAAAEAGLHDRHVDAPLGHLPQRASRQQFELGHVIVLPERAVDPLGRPRRLPDRRSELRALELALAEAQALAVGGEVWREVGGGQEPVALEYRRDHPRGRGLAVGAEHVDRVEAPLG